MKKAKEIKGVKNDHDTMHKMNIAFCKNMLKCTL